MKKILRALIIIMILIKKDIIVVIPVTDFNGKYMKVYRDEIFKDLHMIFVESGGLEIFISIWRITVM